MVQLTKAHTILNRLITSYNNDNNRSRNLNKYRSIKKVIDIEIGILIITVTNSVHTQTHTYAQENMMLYIYWDDGVDSKCLMQEMISGCIVSIYVPL